LLNKKRGPLPITNNPFPITQRGVGKGRGGMGR